MRLLRYFKIITACLIISSCNSHSKEEKQPVPIEGKPWVNKYVVFDEPNTNEIRRLRFYLLAVSYDFLDSMTILSIRADSTTIQGFFKKVPWIQIPPLFPNKDEVM